MYGAFLIRDFLVICLQLPKIQVDLLDDSNLMLSLVNGADTIAAQLHAQMCRELKLPETASKIFAIWICSESLRTLLCFCVLFSGIQSAFLVCLELQLKSEHKPVRHMEVWKTKVLTSFADCADINQEEPRLVFRRSAHLSVAEERAVRSETD